MRTPAFRHAVLLAAAFAVATLGGCAARGDAGSGAVAVQSDAANASPGDAAATQGPQAQSPYSIPF